MGKFYLYSTLTPMELYSLVDHIHYSVGYGGEKQYKLNFEVDEHDVSPCEAIWNNLMLVERYPNDRVYYGENFKNHMDWSWRQALEWMQKNGWMRCCSIILDEVFEDFNDARQAVYDFNNAVIKTKSAQEHLMGFR